MKRVLSFLMIAAIVSIAIVSCKDDFNEEDFLRLQAELKMQQDSVMRARDKAELDFTSEEAVQSYIDALNEAGDLMALTILIRDNDVPVDGVTVRLFSGTPESSSGRAKAEQMQTTDASGNVTFDRVTIGQSTINISKNGYTTATALVDLCCVGQPTPIQVNVNGVTKTHYVVPPKVFSNLLLPMFAKTGTATATITGKVTIETDVTNQTPEIPQNLTIAANFTNLPAATNGANAFVTSYSFDDANFGTATVNNTTGEYSMVVPATTNGYTVAMVMPTIETTQTIAAAFVDGVAIPTGPEYRNQLTTFGPNAGTYTAVPAIFGAKAVFDAPPAPGRGFSITTPTAVARSLPQTSISANGITTVSNVSFNLASRGRGFTSSPTVNVQNGGGAGATATTALQGKITTAAITNGGDGYTPGVDYWVLFFYTNATGDQVLLAGPVVVTANAGGNIPTGNLVLPSSIGFPNGASYLTTQGIQGFGVKIVPEFGTVASGAAGGNFATVAYTNDNEVASIAISNGGTGFTSAPTFSFGGGGSPSSYPTFTVAAFRTQFDFSLNSTNTTPYRVLPSDLSFTYPANNVDGITIEASGLVDRISNGFTAGAVGATFISQVMTDGTNILAINSSQGFRTNRFSVFPPTLSIVDRPTTQARAFVNVSSTTGQVTSLVDPTTGTFANDVVGSGYDSYNSFTIMPSAPTAPGTGAQVNLTLTSDVNTKVVTWAGASTLLAGGSGYLDELNQLRVPFGSGIAPRSTTMNVIVSAGQTTVFNYNYGSGVPKVNLAGAFR